MLYYVIVVKIWIEEKEIKKMQNLLNEEITAELQTLNGMTDIGNGEYSEIIKGVTSLIDRSTAIDKLEIDKEMKLREQDQQLYLQEMQLQLQKDQYISDRRSKTAQILITIGTAVLTAAITVWGTNTTLKFEEEGIVTTSAGKSFLGRLIPKK